MSSQHNETQDVSSHDARPTNGTASRNSWLYRQFHVFGRATPWYASPKIQLGMVALVCFLCPGMFNALSGLGGGGRTDPQLADDMNTALFATFAVVSFFSGTIINRLGVRFCLAFGGIGYGIYAISLLVSTYDDVPAFNIVAGVLLGICAALLWTAQGTIMISYPTESQKGHYFAWFWAIFNMGAVIGSLIPLAQNINVKVNKTVSSGTYIGFIVLMFLGAALALLIVDAKHVVRPDYSRVIVMKSPTWQTELWGLWEALRFQPYIVLLFPMFFASNWFYNYQQNSVNSARSDTRTKSLNNLLYWLAQIVAAVIWGWALDFARIRRRTRARIAYIVLFVMTMAIWGGGFAYQKLYTRESVAPGSGYQAMDWSDPGYVAPMFLYIFYGFFDAVWQATVYWLMGSLSNSGRRSANYVGFYKGIQSAGSAIVNNLDARKLSYEAEFLSNWILLAAAVVIAAPIFFFKVKDHVAIEDDLDGTDEKVEDVLPIDADTLEDEKPAVV